jgi:arsenical pump membrane protein
VLIGALLALAPVLALPLGRLASPFALLAVLPPLALALEAFGWSGFAAAQLRRVARPVSRLLAAYGVWLLTSTFLTLDVAAVAGASVGTDAAGEHAPARRWHLGAAMLGSNTGSLLFPFSNLTNLVLVGASGTAFGAYVAAAWAPQLAAAIAVGAVLAWRANDSGDLHPAEDLPAEPPRPGRRAGAVAAAGAIGAIGFGVAGLDMAVPFALSAGVLTVAALLTGRVRAGQVGRSLPLGALALVAVAAALIGPAGDAAAGLPHPGADAGGLVLATAVGGLAAALLNNLPAAAFGAVWLVHAPPSVVVAYLVGTNIVAMATPHGSAATMLVRAGGHRRGVRLPALDHLRGAWRYAAAGAVAAVAALVAVSR